jgi:hypothetical protein
MADPRTFVLIGEFKDGITPELAKINNQLAQLQQTFSKIGGKGARTASRDLGKFNASVEGLNNTLQQQNKVLRSTIEPMRQYRREVGKTVGALKKLDEAGGRSIAIERTNKALQEQIRLMDQLRSRRGVAPARMPREPGLAGGGGGRGPRPPRGGGGGGFEGHMAEFGFAYTLGNAISQPIQNAIVTGFQIGVGFMVKPFQYFADNIKERIEDQQSDIKAAGGIFSISKRMKDPLVRTMDEAMEFTQQNNKRMEELAAVLPGSTEDYIQVGKRISDSIARIVTRDEKASLQYANQLRAERGAEMITETGRAGTKKAYTEMLGKMTTQTVLAGLGTGGGGAGGVVGAYGLPALTERMLTQDEVSMGQFQRYAAIFKDPLIMEALSRFIPKINATTGGTLERFKIMDKFFQEVLPPEMIRKFEKSAAGIIEAFRTSIFGKEGGLFGLGRKMTGLGKTMDDFGNYIRVLDDGTRMVVTKMEDATDAELDLFNMFSDTIGNLAVVLFPIVQNLSKIWDPLRKVGTLLTDARHIMGRLLFSFESYKGGLMEMVKGMPDARKKEFLKIGVDLRASLAAINNLFRGFGVISKADFTKNAELIMSDSFDVKKMIQGMIDQFMKSDLATSIGETIGKIIGTVLAEVSKVTGFISGRIEGTGNLVSGFQKGFEGVGGPEAITNIFKDVFKTIFNVFKSLFAMLPWQAKLIGAIMIVAPAVIQGLAMLIAESVGKGILAMGKRCAGMIPGAIGGSCPTGPGGRPITGTGGRTVARSGRRSTAGSFFIGEAAASRISNSRQGMMLPGMLGMQPGRSLIRQRGFMGGAARFGARAGKFVPGGALAFGGIDAAMRMASGEDAGSAIGKAAAATFGSVVGGAIGTLIAPGIGTAVGSVVGGLVTDWAVSGIAEQNEAAKKQVEAANKQLQAASESATSKYGEFGAKLGGVEALNQALGGGAGIQKYAQEQLALGKILPEQAQSWDILGNRLTGANQATAKVKDLQAKLAIATRANTGEQEKLAKMLAAAKEEQKRKLSELTKGWEEMSTTNRIKILQGADNVRAALDAAAGRIGSWQPRTPQNPNPNGTPNLIPQDPNQATIERRKGIASLQAKYRAQGKQLGTVEAAQKYDAGERYMGSLGDAVASEMRMKPPGSDLVVANTSETIIPAAGGHGMLDFVETLRSGFNAMISTYKEAQTKQENTLKSINTTLVTNQQQTNARLQKLETKFTTPGIAGGLGGASAGGVDAFTGMAQQYGLSMTSGYRPGDPGWHGADRARDFSNGTGPTPQMMAFAQFLASNYGANLKELIYTPLGFSIKNGQKVAPYAQGSHYNHVHVAYALGYNNGRMFTSLDAAQSWENSMVPGSVRVSSITGNSAEGFGGQTAITNNITINGANQDANQIAALVVRKIGEAVNDVESASLFNTYAT